MEGNLAWSSEAEKLLKKANPRQWAKLQKIITRLDGKNSVAPESDAITNNPENDLEDVDAIEADAKSLEEITHES